MQTFLLKQKSFDLRLSTLSSCLEEKHPGLLEAAANDLESDPLQHVAEHIAVEGSPVKALPRFMGEGIAFMPKCVKGCHSGLPYFSQVEAEQEDGCPTPPSEIQPSPVCKTPRKCATEVPEVVLRKRSGTSSTSSGIDRGDLASSSGYLEEHDQGLGSDAIPAIAMQRLVTPPFAQLESHGSEECYSARRPKVEEINASSLLPAPLPKEFLQVRVGPRCPIGEGLPKHDPPIPQALGEQTDLPWQPWSPEFLHPQIQKETDDDCAAMILPLHPSALELLNSQLQTETDDVQNLTPEPSYSQLQTSTVDDYAEINMAIPPQPMASELFPHLQADDDEQMDLPPQPLAAELLYPQMRRETDREDAHMDLPPQPVPPEPLHPKQQRETLSPWSAEVLEESQTLTDFPAAATSSGSSCSNVRGERAGTEETVRDAPVRPRGDNSFACRGPSSFTMEGTEPVQQSCSAPRYASEFSSRSISLIQKRYCQHDIQTIRLSPCSALT